MCALFGMVLKLQCFKLAPPNTPNNYCNDCQKPHNAQAHENAVAVLLLPGRGYRLCGSGFCIGGGFLIGYPGSSYQEPVGIYSERGAGHQGAVVLPGDNLQILRFIGKNRFHLVNLIGQGLVQHLDIKHIARFQLVQVGQQLLGGKAAVAGDNAVGAAAADGQAGSQ